MRGFLFSLLVFLFLFLVPFIYLRGKNFPSRPKDPLTISLEDSEKEYRKKKVEEIVTLLTSEEKGDLEPFLQKLLSLLPKEENNRVVETVVQKVKGKGREDLLPSLFSLRVYWEPDPEKVAQGRVIYQNRCMTCHGKNGDGVPVTPEGLKKNDGTPIYPRDFTGRFHKDGKVVFKYTHLGFGGELAYEEDLKETIRNGIPGTPMPGFSELSEEDLSSLIEYIKALRSDRWKFFPSHSHLSPVTPPVDLTSPERVNRGRGVFLGLCMACHGNPETGGEPLKGLVLDWYAYNEKGEVVKKEGSDGSPVFQSVVPRRFGREPLARPSPQGIYTTIRYGIGGTPMTGFPQLSEETIWDLVSYISYLREKNYASP